MNGMTESEAVEAIRKWRVARKAFTDRESCLRKQDGPLPAGVMNYSGDNTPIIRLMSVVEERRLRTGDNFENKDILLLRIAEEANLR